MTPHARAGRAASSEIVAGDDERGISTAEPGESVHQDIQPFARGQLSEEQNDRTRPEAETLTQPTVFGWRVELRKVDGIRDDGDGLFSCSKAHELSPLSVGHGDEAMSVRHHPAANRVVENVLGEPPPLDPRRRAV